MSAGWWFTPTEAGATEVPVPDELKAAIDLVASGGWYVGQVDSDDAEIVGFWAGQNDTSTLDVTAAFFPGAAGGDEIGAAQDYTDDWPPQDVDDPWWSHVYGFPDYAAEALAPPEATTTAIVAAQPGFSDDFQTYVPEETTDYASPSVLDTPTEWPPPPSDVEAQAAQPLFSEHDFDRLTAVETQDYANDSALDVTPQFFLPAAPEPDETFAAQPHYGEYLWPAEETEDYASPSVLDTPTEWFPPPTDAEAQAAQPSFDAQDSSAWIPPETKDYATSTPLDATFLDAEAPLEVHAAQPSFDAQDPSAFIAEETLDYANETTLDVSAQWSTLYVEPIETFASQPHYGEAFWPEPETEDYANESALDVTYLIAAAPAIEPDTTFAAQPHYGDIGIDPEETQDYQPESTLGIEAAFLTSSIPPELAALGEPQNPELFIPDEVVQDYSHDPTLDVAAFFGIITAEPIETFAAQLHYGDWAYFDAEADYYSPTTVDVLVLGPPPVFAEYGGQGAGVEVDAQGTGRDTS